MAQGQKKIVHMYNVLYSFWKYYLSIVIFQKLVENRGYVHGISKLITYNDTAGDTTNQWHSCLAAYELVVLGAMASTAIIFAVFS